MLDGALVIFGGALLLTPGFITDILGLVLLIPPTRALVRGIVSRRIAHRMVASATRARDDAGSLRRRGHRRGHRRRADRAAPGGALTDRSAERARNPTGPGFADAVTFSFADPATGLYGMARPVLSGDGTASVTAVLFAGGELVAQVTDARRPHRRRGSSSSTCPVCRRR